MHSSVIITVSTRPFSRRWWLFLSFKQVQELTDPFIQLSDFSNHFGAGYYNNTVAGELRFQRIQDSIATNPEFSFVSPRYFTAYAETVFPFLFSVDGRISDGQLNLTIACGFFQNSSMPDGFFCANRSIGFNEINDPIGNVFSTHPIKPGKNQGVNNYVFDPTSASFTNDPCLLYYNFVNQTVWSLYPNPTGALRDALNVNLNTFYGSLQATNCTQLYSFGQWGSIKDNSSLILLIREYYDFHLQGYSNPWIIFLLLYMIFMILSFDKFVGLQSIDLENR